VINLIFIAVAGGIGAVSRYGVDAAASAMFGRHFPYGTLIANIVGCFLMGLIMHWSMSIDNLPRHVHLMLTTGFLGAFTTFSTFGYQTIQLVENGNYAAAGLNVLLSVAVGLLAAWGGLSLGRTLI